MRARNSQFTHHLEAFSTANSAYSPCNLKSLSVALVLLAASLTPSETEAIDLNPIKLALRPDARRFGLPRLERECGAAKIDGFIPCLEFIIKTSGVFKSTASSSCILCSQ